MEFRLTYEGLLKNKGGADHVHEIRKHFHRQLKRLWQIHPVLSYLNRDQEVITLGAYFSWDHVLAGKHAKFGYRFVPLAVADDHAVVSLDVLFLRSGKPGSILLSADLDARLKRLIDALRMPAVQHELGNYTAPDVEEDPFFCLMEDDKLVGSVAVTTDTLLDPTPSATNGYHETHDARVIVHVKLRQWGKELYGS